MSETVNINLTDLEPHVKNKKFFQPLKGDDWEAFVNDIADRGIVEDLIITPSETKGKYKIVSGHNRLRAAEKLEFETVPCSVKYYETEDDLIDDLIRTNVMRRQLTIYEKFKLVAELQERIKNRQGQGGGNYSGSDKERTLAQNEPKFEQPRDIICKQIGLAKNDYTLAGIFNGLPENVQKKIMNWAERTDPSKKDLRYEMEKYRGKYKETKKELSALKGLKAKKDDIEQKAAAFEEMTRHLSDPQRMHDAESWKKVIDEIHKVMDFLPRTIPVILDTPISDEIKENLATAVQETATMMEQYRGELLRHFIVRKYELVEDLEDDDDIITLGR